MYYVLVYREYVCKYVCSDVCVHASEDSGCWRREWSRLNCGNAPSARSAHQACVCGGYYWVFGGEFNSPSGNKFKLVRASLPKQRLN